MPLSLDCICSDGASLCTPAALTLFLTVDRLQAGSPTIAAAHEITVFADEGDSSAPFISLADPGPGTYEYDLPIADWKDRWATIRAYLQTSASGVQVPDPPFSAYDLFQVTLRIDQHQQCTNEETGEVSDWLISSYARDLDDDVDCTLDQIRTLCFSGGGLNSILYKSGPLSACDGCTISVAGFEPSIDALVQKIDREASDGFCLCPSGGTGPYGYDIAEGWLPAGVTLDGETGCLEGEASGAWVGTPEITFRVTDLSNGLDAEVTCAFMGGLCNGLEFLGNDLH